MNKNLKLLTSALLICGTVLSAVPANAATKDKSAKADKETVAVEKPNADIEAKSGEPVNITGYNVCLRKSANTSSKVLELLNPSDSKNCRFIGYEYTSSGTWLHIGYKTSNGWIYGYVSSDYASL
ncbi:hypothetical protein ACQR2L_01590 [Clostridium butyricum]|uniref:hypothetical protein n=1 Tax=Clostridium butyricum TaxID=1492 RepID=UPI00374F2616